MKAEFYREVAEVASVCARFAKFVGGKDVTPTIREIYEKALPWRERVRFSWLEAAKKEVERELTVTIEEPSPASVAEEILYDVELQVGQDWECMEGVWIYRRPAPFKTQEEEEDCLRGRCRSRAGRLDAALKSLRGFGVSADEIRAPDSRAVVDAIREATDSSESAVLQELLRRDNERRAKRRQHGRKRGGQSKDAPKAREALRKLLASWAEDPEKSKWTQQALIEEACKCINENRAKNGKLGGLECGWTSYRSLLPKKRKE